LSETQIEAQLIEGARGDGLVRCEIEDRLGSFIVASDGNAVAGGEAREKGAHGLKVAALEEVDSRASLDEEKNLGGLVDAEEIRDGLFDTIIEYMEFLAAKASDKPPSRVRDEHSNVDAIDANANVRSSPGRLLRKSVGYKRERANNRKGGAAWKAKQHERNSDGRPGSEKTEAPFRAEFPERGTGLGSSDISCPKGLPKAWWLQSAKPPGEPSQREPHQCHSPSE
jgi:hypothetical protein